MSVKERKLFQIGQRIRELKVAEKEVAKAYPRGVRRYVARAETFGYMLFFEVVRNDVAIRAESLSYFTMFSILPLIAGAFFFFSFFARFAPVQREFSSLLEHFLGAIPDEQRATLVNFMFQFKDQYIARLSGKSTTIAALAFSVLVWIAGKVFFNMEALMNRIWGVGRERPFIERIQNFVFSIVIFPLAFIAALSLPRVIEYFGQRDLGVFIHKGIPFFIFFFSLTFMFRYFPNTFVRWKSAMVGAASSTVCFAVSNFFLGFYFRFGATTAYGKLAILPIFAFFIYVGWMIFIGGVEVSLIYQTGDAFSGARLPQATLGQGLILEKCVHYLNDRVVKDLGPIGQGDLMRALHVNSEDVFAVLRYLRDKKLILCVENSSSEEHDKVKLAHPIDESSLIDIIKDFLNLSQISQNFDVNFLLSRLK